MWINPETLQRFALHSEIRAAFPNVSFPAAMSEQDIESVGLASVAAQPLPAFNPITHEVVELAPALVGEQWTQQWQVNALSQEVAAANLAAARAARWEAIKAERDRRTQQGGYLAAGKWFHSDVFSRTQQIGLVMLGANLPQGLQWKTMDNSMVEMTQTLAAQVFGAAAASDTATFAHAETLRAQVYASDSPAEVDIDAGWPEVFG